MGRLGRTFCVVRGVCGSVRRLRDFVVGNYLMGSVRILGRLLLALLRATSPSDWAWLVASRNRTAEKQASIL